jgi:hypothetical protein
MIDEDDDCIHIEINPEPMQLRLALNGKMAKIPMTLDVGLAFITQLLDVPAILDAIILPKIVKRFLVWIVFKSYERSLEGKIGDT